MGTRPAALKIEPKRPRRRVVGQHQLIERIGHEHGIGDAVKNGLGVLPPRRGDFELDFQLFQFHGRVADGLLGVSDHLVDGADQRHELAIAGIQVLELACRRHLVKAKIELAARIAKQGQRERRACRRQKEEQGGEIKSEVGIRRPAVDAHLLNEACAAGQQQKD